MWYSPMFECEIEIIHRYFDVDGMPLWHGVNPDILDGYVIFRPHELEWIDEEKTP